jgi:hypothetical protein
MINSSIGIFLRLDKLVINQVYMINYVCIIQYLFVILLAGLKVLFIYLKSALLIKKRGQTDLFFNLYILNVIVLTFFVPD